MNRSRYFAAIILLLVTAAVSLGELPPYVYKEQQEKADEALVVKVQSVETVDTKQPDETQTAVTVLARVEKVERTKFGLTEGDKIRILYTRRDRKEPMPGPRELPILSKDQTYPAFLNQDGKNKDYVPAAGGRSFDRMEAQSERPTDKSYKTSDTNLSVRVPDWVPIYPGTSATAISSHQAGNEHYFNFEMITHEACAKVVDWYEEKLHAAGYNLYGRFDYAEPNSTSTVRSDGPGNTRSINVRVSWNVDDTTIAIESVERNVTGGATAALPNWVPIYPGVQVNHMDASKAGDDAYHLGFSFATIDDPAKVYSWYESKLKAMKFRVSATTTPNSVGHFVANTSDGHRTLNMRNFPTTPENTFTVEVVER